MIKVFNKIIPTIVLTLIITSCGGGGGGGGSDSPTPPATPAATSSISLSSEKGYVGGTVTVTWSSTNATSCTASNAWTGTKGTSGSETFSLEGAGSFTFEISCSGSGGSGSASATLKVFQYDKQTDDVTNKTWDAEGFATILEGIAGWVTSFDYSGEDSTNLLTVTAFEPSDSSFELDYSGSTEGGNSFDFSLVFNDWNTSTTLLYDPDDTENAAYALIRATYADAVVDGFLTLPDYYSNQGIDYVSSALVEIFTTPTYYLIPTNVGEFTETDDVPSSGTSSKTFDTLGYYYEASVDGGNIYNGYIVADGQGTLDFDFSNNTVGGSFTYDTFAPYTSFKEGNATYNLITQIPEQTITLQNGTISDNSFIAQIVIDDGETTGSGLIKGHFYGPNADEIAVNIILLDNDDNENDFFIFTAGGIGQTQ